MDLLVRGLAVWRLSEMLVNEDGPLNLFNKLRTRTGLMYSYTIDGEYKVSYWPSWNPLHCVYCTSVWVGLVLTLLPRKVSVPLALSGIAVLMNEGAEKWL